MKAALKDAIKSETRIVVEGRLMALKTDRSHFTDFAKRVKALAE